MLSGRRFLACIALFAVLDDLPMTALAHHSTAEFDYSKTVFLTGIVKEFQWMNPHSYVEIMVPDKSGVLVQWSIEVGTPDINIKAGWRKDSIRPGDKVSLNVAPARNGSRHGTLRVMTLPDGRQLIGVASRVGVDAQGNAQLNIAPPKLVVPPPPKS
jgi:hypothetical protein